MGFLVGGVAAATVILLLYLVFEPAPSERTPHDHSREALVAFSAALFFAGGFIGRRGINADFYSDLLPPVIGTYLILGFLCVLAGLGIIEIAAAMGIVTVGIVASATVSLLLLRWFPPKTGARD
jgi:hypothetical protein